MRYCPQCGRPTEQAACPEDGTPTVRRVASVRGDLVGGEVVGGRYRIVRVIGRGGFGTVYEAEHVTTGHPVALKVLVAQPGSEGDELARRFFKEAATTSRLSHPNTVRVFDFGQSERGDLFLAMERLVGETLMDQLSRLHSRGETMAEEDAVEIAIAVLRSLGEAHAHGLVHRDLKPANIFLHQLAGGEAIIKVLDFGIVKDIDAHMTQAGKALGTPTHMSPEQAMGKAVDGRSDLYALGVLLFECISGNLPFQSESPLAIVMMHVIEPVPSLKARAPGKVRPAVAAVAERALSKDPAERFTDANDMRVALQRALRESRHAPAPLLGATPRSSRTIVGPPSVAPLQVAAPRAAIAARGQAGRSEQPTASGPDPGSAAPRGSIRVRLPPRLPSTSAQVAVDDAQVDDRTALGVPAMADDPVGDSTDKRPRRATLPAHGEAAANPVQAATAAPKVAAAAPPKPRVPLPIAPPPPARDAEPRQGGPKTHEPATAQRFPAAPAPAPAPAVAPAAAPAVAASGAVGDEAWLSLHKAPTVVLPAKNDVGAPSSSPVAAMRPVVELLGAASDAAVASSGAATAASSCAASSASTPPSVDEAAAAQAARDTETAAQAFEARVASAVAEALNARDAQAAADALADPRRVAAPDNMAKPSADDDGGASTWMIVGGEEDVEINADESALPEKRADSTVQEARASRAESSPRNDGAPRPSTLGRDGAPYAAIDRSRIEAERERLRALAGLGAGPRVGGLGTRRGAEFAGLAAAIPSHGMSDRFARDLVRITDGLRQRQQTIVSERGGQVSAVWIAEDLHTLLTGSPSGEVRLCHVDDVDFQARDFTRLDAVTLGAHSGRVLAVTGVGDTDAVATLSTAGELRLAAARDGALRASTQLDNIPTSLACSADGRLLIVGCQDGSAALFDAPELTLRRTLRGHREPVGCVAIASARRTLVTGSDDGNVRTWDPIGGGARITQPAHGCKIGAVALTRDARLCASGGWDGRLLVWEVRNGDILVDLQAHADVIAGLAFSNDGAYVATASDDRSVRVFDVALGREVAVREGLDAGGRWLRFADDGRSLVAATWHGSVLRVPVS